MTIPTITSFEQVDTTGISHILLDIEGTTCPVEFVSDVLFPYASEHLGDFLRHKGDSKTVKSLLEQTKKAWESEINPSAPQWQGNTGDVVPYLQWLSSIDRKFRPLKELQGMVWKQGYRNGELEPQLFPDVPPMLRRWAKQGITMAVYSSGSINAQRLLYKHCTSGDMRPFFRHWFDTGVGQKINPDSYRKIKSEIKADHVERFKALFISDSRDELIACIESGLIPLERECKPT